MLLVLVSIFLRVGILASKNPVHGDKTVTAREFFSKRRVVEDVGLEFPAARTRAEFSDAQLPQARVNPLGCLQFCQSKAILVGRKV